QCSAGAVVNPALRRSTLKMAAKPQNNSSELGTGRVRPTGGRGTARSASRAFATSAALSVLFLVVYGGCNWITSQRADVATFYFQWERAIPFVPFFILPYMSIDLF